MIFPVVRTRSMAAVVALGAVLLSACGQTPAGVAAVVNGAEISDRDLQVEVASARAELTAEGVPDEEQFAQLRDVQRTVLTAFIRNTITEQEAQRRGLAVTEAEVEEVWQTQIAIFGSDEELQARLVEVGITEAEAREQLRSEELNTRLQEAVRAEIVVDEAELQALYDSQLAQWLTRTASHIAVATQQEADEVKALLDADPTLFESIALERSLDTNTGALGGLLPEQPRDAFPLDFDDLVWETAPGDISGPIQTDFGFHIIRVENEVFRTLDEVREPLAEQLAGQVFQQIFADLQATLLANADVKIDGRFGTWDVNIGEVVLADPMGS
ncbi:MAG: foldase protein PrsA [Glaciecola sp.]